MPGSRRTEAQARGPRVHIRHPDRADHAELAALTRRSAALHAPWVPQRETTPEAFDAYLGRIAQPPPTRDT